MLGKTYDIFKLFGFTVRIDASWSIIAILAVWTLSAGFFPSFFPDLSESTYWLMGIAGTLGLFLSVVLHEMAHSLVGRRHGMVMRGITLFIFGGIAEMEDEPPTAKSEFLMAVAGPLASILLGAAFALARLPLPEEGPAAAVGGVLYYLAYINFILAIFNLIPAFPLDGGRILRSALWAWKGRLRWATRIASAIGGGFGILLMALGVIYVFQGTIIGGVWFFLIGLFLRNASRVSYRQLLFRKALEGERVRRFMVETPVTVPSWITLEDFVDQYIGRYRHRLFPVVEDSRLLGCVTTDQVREVPREHWPHRRVESLVLAPCGENSVGPDDAAEKAMLAMSRSGQSRFMVVDGGRLAGTIILQDLLRFISTKVDVDGGSRGEDRPL